VSRFHQIYRSIGINATGRRDSWTRQISSVRHSVVRIIQKLTTVLYEIYRILFVFLSIYRVLEACQAEVIIILATLSAGTISTHTFLFTHTTCMAPKPTPRHTPGTLFKVLTHPDIGSSCVNVTVDDKNTTTIYLVTKKKSKSSLVRIVYTIILLKKSKKYNIEYYY